MTNGVQGTLKRTAVLREKIQEELAAFESAQTLWKMQIAAEHVKNGSELLALEVKKSINRTYPS